MFDQGTKIYTEEGRPGFTTVRDQLLPNNPRSPDDLQPQTHLSSKPPILFDLLLHRGAPSATFIGMIQVDKLFRVHGIEGADPG